MLRNLAVEDKPSTPPIEKESVPGWMLSVMGGILVCTSSSFHRRSITLASLSLPAFCNVAITTEAESPLAIHHAAYSDINSA
jgi:hypothetical protein